MANDLVLHAGFIIPVGFADIQADHAEDAAFRPFYRKGQYMVAADDYGTRIFRYMHNKAGAATKLGGLYSRAADVAVASIDSGSTTVLIKKAAGFTAGALRGRVAYYLTNNTTAGAAPEGESAIIVDNDAGSLTLDSKRPFSATPNAADAVTVFSLFDFIASASGDLAFNVFGVAVATNFISNNNWGVLQQYGWCPDLRFKASTSLAANRALIADVEQVTASSTSAVDLCVGMAHLAVNATNGLKTTGFINVYDPVPKSA